MKLRVILCAAILTIASNVFAQNKNQTKKFGLMDTNKNELVTIEEMMTFHKGKTNKNGKPIDAELMFLGLDTDGNGELTLKEFSQPIDWKMAKEKRKAIKEQAKPKKKMASKDMQTKKFGWIDLDKNKAITLEELKEFHKGKTTKNGEPIKTELMFLGMDANNDGAVNLEEFKQPIDWKAAKQKLKK